MISYSDQHMACYTASLCSIAVRVTSLSHRCQTVLGSMSYKSNALLFRVTQCPLIVKHVLIDCSDFTDICNKYFVASTMKDSL